MAAWVRLISTHPFIKKVLYITKRKREPNIKHYGKSDDFRARLKVAE